MFRRMKLAMGSLTPDSAAGGGAGVRGALLHSCQRAASWTMQPARVSKRRRLDRGRRSTNVKRLPAVGPGALVIK